MKPVDLEMFGRFSYPVKLEANGRDILFSTKMVNWEADRYDTGLSLLRQGEVTQLLPFGPLQDFWMIPGGKTAVLARPAKGDDSAPQDGCDYTKLQYLPLNRPGEARTVMYLKFPLAQLQPVDKKRMLLVVEADSTAADWMPQSQTEGCTVLNRLPCTENGSGFLGTTRHTLMYWEDGKNLVPLTDANTDVEDMRLSQCGRRLYYTAISHPTVAPMGNRLMCLDLESFAIQDISIRSDFRHDAFVPMKDGSLVVAGSDMQRYGVNQNPAFYRLEPERDHVEVLYREGEYSGWNSVATDLSMSAAPRWCAEGDWVYWVSAVDESSHLMRIHAKTGEIEQITQSPGMVAGLARITGKTLVIAMRQLANPGIYWVRDDGEETPFERSAYAEDIYELQRPRPLAITNSRGTEIRGWVLPPAGQEPGRHYPAILDVHGGPKGVYGPVLVHEMQYWAAQGYGVVYCNPTGGDGRGDTFADIRGGYGGIDYEDLMAFLDEALAQHPWIDPARLGITGGSYGGYMVNWAIGQSTRFAAAASQRGISNWGTMALTSDIGYFFEPDQALTTVWENPQKVWDISPLKYAPRVKTPTLFIHSDGDWRCPLPEALQMFTALQLHGVPTRACIFHGENHELSRSGKPKSRLRRLREITEWFDQYLKPRHE